MLDTVMKANPKLTEAVKAASRRAAENGIGEAKKSAHNSATMSKYANRVTIRQRHEGLQPSWLRR